MDVVGTPHQNANLPRAQRRLNMDGYGFRAHAVVDYDNLRAVGVDELGAMCGGVMQCNTVQQ